MFPIVINQNQTQNPVGQNTCTRSTNWFHLCSWRTYERAKTASVVKPVVHKSSLLQRTNWSPDCSFFITTKICLTRAHKTTKTERMVFLPANANQLLRLLKTGDDTRVSWKLSRCCFRRAVLLGYCFLFCWVVFSFLFACLLGTALEI